MKLFYNLITLSVIATLIGSCTPSSNSSTKNSSQEEKTLHDVDKLLADLPPPSLVPFTLKSIQAPFDKEHINALENLTKYQGNSDKMSLNMGIYASDISYLAAYGKEEECLNYLETAHKMAEVLGDSAIYDQSHLDEFRGHVNSGNEKEIADLLGKLFMETSVQMEEDHHLTLAGLALTGSFIEGLYQAVITLEKHEDSEDSRKLLQPLVTVVLEEEQALRDIIQVLDDLPYDEMIGEMMVELSILDKLYKGDLQKVEEALSNDPDYIVSKEVMRDITLEVKRIRKSIVDTE